MAFAVRQPAWLVVAIYVATRWYKVNDKVTELRD
jgi:hypothetical protein